MSRFFVVTFTTFHQHSTEVINIYWILSHGLTKINMSNEFSKNVFPVSFCTVYHCAHFRAPHPSMCRTARVYTACPPPPTLLFWLIWAR